MVLECAVASGSDFIVTHNTKDFRRVEELNVRAVTPANFLNLLREPPGGGKQPPRPGGDDDAREQPFVST